MKTEVSPRMKVALYGLMCVLLIPFVFPTWWMVTSSVKPISDIFAFPPQLVPQNYDWTTYQKVFELQPFVQQYWNSAYIAAVVTIGTMVVSSMAGYAFARIRFPFANTIFMIVLLGLLIPSEVTIVPLFQMFLKAGMVNTHWPLILVPIFGAPSVFATFVMRQFFVTLPTELEEAARVDGLGRLKIFRKIALPLAKPALASVAIFTFLHSWNLFLEPIVFLENLIQVQQ
ncbi:carbohydrate ABC transporter permease [Sinorhizobium garamanticum]|uniref:Carbohydrate ABC transporter permease n=1 Tax=Sinorhizobium garamanticum TaxID=680247 RepID=A0ABY8DJA2_9HYPH|nr:carbohydrate ABC transporter permease [Sinorhizobium garamanticum]WEX90991.1 carbohydrate ABC transporter permease [Sinorhizobium garamanticum]